MRTSRNAPPIRDKGGGACAGRTHATRTPHIRDPPRGARANTRRSHPPQGLHARSKRGDINRSAADTRRERLGCRCGTPAQRHATEWTSQEEQKVREARREPTARRGRQPSAKETQLHRSLPTHPRTQCLPPRTPRCNAAQSEDGGQKTDVRHHGASPDG